MKLWRISDFANLSGDGGLRFSARWHTVGHRIVYCAEHPAGSLVEHLVHINWGVMPDRFQLLTIDIEDGVAMDEIAAENLPDGWRNDLAVTRSKGDAWLASDSTLLCRVPSVILPEGSTCTTATSTTRSGPKAWKPVVSTSSTAYPGNALLPMLHTSPWS